MTRTIKHSFFYSHSAEIVWEYLTNSELMAQWLMPNDFMPEVGHEFRFTIKPIPEFEFDGIIYCKVMEIVPYKKLVYSWKGGPGDGSINLDSVVTWTLVTKENGTELLLEHSGLMKNISIYEAMNKGWKENIAKIDELINKSTHGATKA
ncbi:MAG: SRPBCC domain-containing protein [Bacteroidetes bacterium]|nr:SRPBCC domain-containing protein [Bacteroidota bacterium]